MSTDRPFKRLLVENEFAMASTRRVLVYWVMNEAFAQPGPYTFTLQRGRSVNDDAYVNVATVVDQPWLYDNNPTFLPFDTSTFYRVLLTDGAGTTYTSQVQSTSANWNHHDWRVAKEVTRKELLVRRLAGTGGWLLKRRLFGAVCGCVDTNNNQVDNSHCAICYGTSIVGGYYAALRTDLMPKPQQRLKRLTAEQGLTTTVMVTGDLLAWPEPAQNDIWVDGNANLRYRINSDIEVTALIRSVPLKIDVRLTLLPNTDVVYEFPTPALPPQNVTRG